MKSKRYFGIVAVATALAGLAIAMPAFAQTSTPVPGTNPGWQGRGPGMMGRDRIPGMMSNMKPGIFGTVTAVNGTSLTVSGHSLAGGPAGSPTGANATTTYTVDASGATVLKDNATSTLSAVAVNDRIFIQGTITGTSVVATVIRDGIPMMHGRGPGMMGTSTGDWKSGTPPITGNGQPVVAGTVSTVNGTTLAITTSSNTSYTIDASTAKVTKGGNATTVSTIASGDYIVVQGGVNGTSVTAASIIDQPAPPANNAGGNGNGNGPAMHDNRGGGFLDSIGSFFKHLFGF